MTADLLKQIRNALRAGHPINPRVIEQLVDDLSETKTDLAKRTGERNRACEELAKVEGAVKRMPKRKDYVRVRAAAVVAVGVFISGVGVGLILAHVFGGG
jgi:2,3-bisphosphoglycerate-independent phosphoglycerate mutase